MATKKKFSAAQITAQKKFAAASRAGTLKKKKATRRKSNPTMDNPGVKSPYTRRRQNPAPASSGKARAIFVRLLTPSGAQGTILATFPAGEVGKQNAIVFAQAYADKNKREVAVMLP